MQNKAFSLVELIVGITISMILMVGVGVLVSGGITNIVSQDKILKNTGDFREFSKDSLGLFSRIDTRLKPKIIFSTSALVKVKQNYNDIGFSFLGLENKTNFYCSGSDVENNKTIHIEIKHFLPFEEIGEDIFKNFKDTLYGKSDSFKSYYKSNVIKNSSNQVVVGKKGVFGDKLGEYGTETLLNNPTGLAYDSTNKLLYISDTGNNRILVYNNDSSSTDYKKIFKLLDGNDGLNEPTGLALNGVDILYISNSGDGEILEYSSETSSSKKLNVKFNINKDINNLKNLKIEVFSGITDISKPDSTNQFNFIGISKKSPDYLTGSNNKLVYWFSNFGDNYYNQSNKTCSSNYTKYYEYSGDIIKEQIQDCNSFTGTLKKYKSSSYQNISSGTNIEISTTVNFTGDDFTQSGVYYVKLTLSGSSDYYQSYFPFFINSDQKLLTRNDNTLKIISNDFKYPTGIKYNTTTSKLKINDFWDRKQYSINLDGTGKSKIKDLKNFNFSKIIFNSVSDIVLFTPIKKLNFTFINNIFELYLKYYKKYNCYNLDDNIKRTFILDKSYK